MGLFYLLSADDAFITSIRLHSFTNETMLSYIICPLCVTDTIRGGGGTIILPLQACQGHHAACAGGPGPGAKPAAIVSRAG